MKEFQWNSPYQQESYFQACQKAGFNCVKIEINGNYYFFYQDNGQFVGWEITPPGNGTTTQLSSDYVIYCLSNISSYELTDWEENNYYTYFIQKQQDESQTDCNGHSPFSTRFRRSLSQSLKYQLSHNIAETDSQIIEALDQFKEYPERRGLITYDLFNYYVWQLLEQGIVDIHVVTRPQPERHICGAAIVLKSPSQVNFRYYTSDRLSGNPGHFLHFSMIDVYINNGDYNIIDLSGISSPYEMDTTLKGITEFKLQTKGKVAQFKRMNNI